MHVSGAIPGNDGAVAAGGKAGGNEPGGVAAAGGESRSRSRNRDAMMDPHNSTHRGAALIAADAFLYMRWKGWVAQGYETAGTQRDRGQRHRAGVLGHWRAVR